MGKLWCENIPAANVPRGDPKPVTLVYPYYDNPRFLDEQLEFWRAYPEEFWPHLSLIIVDDGSPDWPVVDRLTWLALPRFPVRAFRIGVDVRWNWLAARNIGMHYADGWTILTDIDHVIPPETIKAAIYGQHDPRLIYCFGREEHTGKVIHSHSASFLMHRDLFWKIGGYDEALSGHYGTDGDWRRRCAQFAEFRMLPERLIRFEYYKDSSTARYLRKQPQDAAVSKIVAKRNPGWRPRALSFSYSELTLPGEVTR